MKIITFWRMPLSQKSMFMINGLLCGIARIITKCFRYQTIAFYFGTPCRMITGSTILSAQQIAQARAIKCTLALAVQYTPWHSNCLTQALVAKFWCQRFKLPYMFFIGFPINAPKPMGRKAHAWVTAGPIVLSGGQSFNTHQVVLSYSSLTLYTAKDAHASH